MNTFKEGNNPPPPGFKCSDYNSRPLPCGNMDMADKRWCRGYIKGTCRDLGK